MKLIIKQAVAPIEPAHDIRVMSYNIRMAPCPEDDGTENDWVHRRPKVEAILREYAPDIIGLQEMSHHQMEQLNKGTYPLFYEFLGKFPSRTPIESGLGIAFNTQKLTCISEPAVLWLNESQISAEGPAWDGSSYERFILYAKFKNNLTGNTFWFLTTHFDHLGRQARSESARIVLDLAHSLDGPAVITGDFNCFPQAGGAELYTLLATTSSRIKDSGSLAASVVGLPGTWIGWEYDPYKQQAGFAKYDYILVDATITVKQHAVIDDRVWDEATQREHYPSDHRPVISDVVL